MFAIDYFAGEVGGNGVGTLFVGRGFELVGFAVFEGCVRFYVYTATVFVGIDEGVGYASGIAVDADYIGVAGAGGTT